MIMSGFNSSARSVQVLPSAISTVSPTDARSAGVSLSAVLLVARQMVRAR